MPHSIGVVFPDTHAVTYLHAEGVIAVRPVVADIFVSVFDGRQVEGDEWLKARLMGHDIGDLEFFDRSAFIECEVVAYSLIDIDLFLIIQFHHSHSGRSYL